MITNLKFLQQNTEAKQHHQQTSTNSLHQTWAMNLWYLPSMLSSIGHSCIKRIDINRPDCRHGKTGQNFLTWPEKYLTQTRFFWPKAKIGWSVTRPVFFCGSTQPATRTIWTLYPYMTKTFALMALDEGFLILALPRGFRFPRRFAVILFSWIEEAW